MNPSPVQKPTDHKKCIDAVKVKSELVSWLKIFIIAEKNHFFRPKCLRSALALRSCLKFVRIPTQLRIGVMPGTNSSPKSLDAHAWLTWNGIVIFGMVPRLDEYQSFQKGEF
jgi:hypothetical protein